MAPDILGVQRCLLFFIRNTCLWGTRGDCVALSAPPKDSQGVWTLWEVTDRWNWVVWEAGLLLWPQALQHYHSPWIYLNISKLVSKALLHFSGTNLKAEAAEAALPQLKWVVVINHQYKL